MQSPKKQVQKRTLLRPRLFNVRLTESEYKQLIKRAPKGELSEWARRQLLGSPDSEQDLVERLYRYEKILLRLREETSELEVDQ